MPARRKGKKRQGEDNCPHQRNYLETLLDGSLCHRYATEEDKGVVLDLTGLILYHYNWIDLNEIMVCMADRNASIRLSACACGHRQLKQHGAVLQRGDKGRPRALHHWLRNNEVQERREAQLIY